MERALDAERALAQFEGASSRMDLPFELRNQLEQSMEKFAKIQKPTGRGERQPVGTYPNWPEATRQSPEARTLHDLYLDITPNDEYSYIRKTLSEIKRGKEAVVSE